MTIPQEATATKPNSPVDGEDSAPRRKEIKALMAAEIINLSAVTLNEQITEVLLTRLERNSHFQLYRRTTLALMKFRRGSINHVRDARDLLTPAMVAPQDTPEFELAQELLSHINEWLNARDEFGYRKVKTPPPTENCQTGWIPC